MKELISDRAGEGEDSANGELDEGAAEKEISPEALGAQFLINASRMLGDTLRKGETLKERASINNRSEAVGVINNLLESAGYRLSSFYKKLKRSLRIAPILFALSTPADNPIDRVGKGIEQRKHELSIPVKERKLGHISQSQLPFSMAITNIFLEGNPVQEYNRAVDLFNRRVDGRMSEGEIEYKEKIAENIDPFGYLASDLDSTLSFIDSSERTPHGRMEAFRRGQRRFDRENIDKLDSKYKIRVDLFRKYLGLPQFNNSVIESPWRPSVEKNPKAKYFSFDSGQVVESIKAEIQRKRRQKLNYKYATTIKIDSFKDLKKYILDSKDFPPSMLSAQLGRYGSYVGHDEERNEDYVSYYDLWDLNPPTLDDIGIDLNQFNFPFELYGRIYESDWNRVSVANN